MNTEGWRLRLTIPRLTIARLRLLSKSRLRLLTVGRLPLWRHATWCAHGSPILLVLTLRRLLRGDDCLAKLLLLLVVHHVGLGAIVLNERIIWLHHVLHW